MSNNQSSLRNDFLRRLRSIRQQTTGDYRAPHKPLLLLIALAGVAQGEERLIEYADCENRLSKLLTEFGPPVRQVKAFEPFKRLPKDGLWELLNVADQSATTIERLTGGCLRDMDAKGGLLKNDHQLLLQDREFLCSCISEILHSNFPLSYHSEIVQTVGLPTIELNAIDSRTIRSANRTSNVRYRDPRFRESILRIYGRACSICRSAVHLNDALMGLEAAHIKWHCHGGPDEESNGLALCIFHHKAFDRGVIGLNNVGNHYTVEVSAKLGGYGPAMSWLSDFEGKKIFKVKNREHQPSPNYIAWHREQVFKD